MRRFKGCEVVVLGVPCVRFVDRLVGPVWRHGCVGMPLMVVPGGTLGTQKSEAEIRIQRQAADELAARRAAAEDVDGDGIAGDYGAPFTVAHTYQGSGPSVKPVSALAHHGQVVRIKTEGRTYFLECDAGDTPTQLIKQLRAQGACNPQMYVEAYKELPIKVPKKKQDGCAPAPPPYLCFLLPRSGTSHGPHVSVLQLSCLLLPSLPETAVLSDVVDVARLQRGPIPLDDNTPIRDQQVRLVHASLTSRWARAPADAAA